MNKRYFSYDNMRSACGNILADIAHDHWHCDLVLGITRGGLVPAVMLSHALEVPCLPINLSYRDFSKELSTSMALGDVYRSLRFGCYAGKNLLLVDDMVDSGRTIATCQNIMARFQDRIGHCKTAVMIHNTTAQHAVTVDYAGEVIDKTQDDAWIEYFYEVDLVNAKAP